MAAGIQRHDVNHSLRGILMHHSRFGRRRGLQKMTGGFQRFHVHYDSFRTTGLIRRVLLHHPRDTVRGPRHKVARRRRRRCKRCFGYLGTTFVGKKRIFRTRAVVGRINNTRLLVRHVRGDGAWFVRRACARIGSLGALWHCCRGDVDGRPGMMWIACHCGCFRRRWRWFLAGR
jgi:hypothetical protein